MRLLKIFCAGLAAFVVFAPSASALAASLLITPASSNSALGQTFSVQIGVESASEAINAASATLLFPTNLLQIVSLSKSGSILNIWAEEPNFSNGEGSVRFEGAALNPGYQGPFGRLLTATFKVKAAGIAEIRFISGSVLANDGQGTNVLSKSIGSTFALASAPVPGPTAPPPSRAPAPVLNSETHGAGSWSNAGNLRFTWTVPDGINGIAYVLSSSTSALPALVPGLPASVNYDLTNFGEGVWRFVSRFRNATGWSNISAWQIGYDATPPEPFSIKQEIRVAEDPRPVLLFSAEDKLSGIARYEIQIDDKPWTGSSSFETSPGRYQLPAQDPGPHTVVVKAMDNAGNTRETNANIMIDPILLPRIESYSNHNMPSRSMLIVSGFSLPSSKVHLLLKNDSKEFGVTTASDKTGNWIAVFGERIPAGDYELTAWSESSLGAKSYKTAPVPVAIGNWFKEKTLTLGQVLAVFALNILALALLVAFAIYAVERLKKFRARIKTSALKLQEDVAALEKDAPTAAMPALGAEIADVRKNVEAELEDLKDLN